MLYTTPWPTGEFEVEWKDEGGATRSRTSFASEVVSFGSGGGGTRVHVRGCESILVPVPVSAFRRVLHEARRNLGTAPP